VRQSRSSLDDRGHERGEEKEPIEFLNRLFICKKNAARHRGREKMTIKSRESFPAVIRLKEKLIRPGGLYVRGGTCGRRITLIMYYTRDNDVHCLISDAGLRRWKITSQAAYLFSIYQFPPASIQRLSSPSLFLVCCRCKRFSAEARAREIEPLQRRASSSRYRSISRYRLGAR